MTNRELMWSVGIWLVAMIALCVLSDCRARAEPPPVIMEFERKPEPPPIKPAPEACFDCVCHWPEGPSPTLLGVLTEELPTEAERQVVETQIARCKRDVVTVADPWLVLAVYRYEELIGVPDEARGILGAVWCMEAAMRTQSADGEAIRGDWQDGRAMAHGPAQLWPWHRAWCGLTEAGADDVLAALGCYWQRVVDRHPKASRCADAWRVAEALTANGPKYQHHGCKAESKHWRELMRWR